MNKFSEGGGAKNPQRSRHSRTFLHMRVRVFEDEAERREQTVEMCETEADGGRDEFFPCNVQLIHSSI